MYLAHPACNSVNVGVCSNHAILQAVQADLLENVLIALHRRWSGFLMDSYHDVTRNLQLAVKLIGAAGSHLC